MKDPQLDAAMRNLAARMAAIEPPASVEAAVMAEFDRAQGRRAGLLGCGQVHSSFFD